MGEFIGHSGGFGTFLYAFAERLLIPTGLHHILNETVRFTPIGGITTVDGESIVGALTIFNAALANPGLIADEVVREATRFLAQGKIPVMMFGLPGAALAMYHCAKLSTKTASRRWLSQVHWPRLLRVLPNHWNSALSSYRQSCLSSMP